MLGGVLNPLEGIGPEDLEVDSLLKRVEGSGLRVQEIIIATNPSLEGETTALHLQKIIKQLNRQISGSADQPIKITRMARGLPMGGDLEYADDITLMRALEGRREF